MNKKRIAIFVSGSGSNAEAVIHYFKGHPTISVDLLLTNNPEAYALDRAKNLNVPAKIFDRTQLQGEILNWLSENKITHIVLAGFLLMIPKSLTDAYPNKIINIHPSLLPKFGGKGMYGLKVHEAVKKAGEVETGLTIHLVNEKYDDGKILKQIRCKISATDTTKDISENVLKLEHFHYPRVIEEWILSS